MAFAARIAQLVLVTFLIASYETLLSLSPIFSKAEVYSLSDAHSSMRCYCSKSSFSKDFTHQPVLGPRGELWPVFLMYNP
jgi:hypothetical protein